MISITKGWCQHSREQFIASTQSHIFHWHKMEWSNQLLRKWLTLLYQTVFSPVFVFHVYKYSIHSWSGLFLLLYISRFYISQNLHPQERICNVIGPELAPELQSLSYCCNVAPCAFFYKYFCAFFYKYFWAFFYKYFYCNFIRRFHLWYISFMILSIIQVWQLGPINLLLK